jgi:hypothetical protein
VFASKVSTYPLLCKSKCTQNVQSFLVTGMRGKLGEPAHVKDEPGRLRSWLADVIPCGSTPACGSVQMTRYGGRQFA